MITKTSNSGNVNYNFKTNAGPPVSDKCPECNSHFHVRPFVPLMKITLSCSWLRSKLAGPMWSGVLHDVNFVTKVIEHVGKKKDHYGTASRMKGMLTVAREVRRPTYASVCL